MAATLAPDTYLMLSRASGFIAYGLLWLAMALGVSIHNKLSRIWPGGPMAYALHRYASLCGLIFTLVHVLLLLGHPALGFSFASLLLPFSGSSYRPLSVGLLGKVSFYLMGIVGLSFYIRSRLGQRLWRLIHYLSFAVFLLGARSIYREWEYPVRPNGLSIVAGVLRKQRAFRESKPLPV